MIRALSILAAVAALAVSAQPASGRASASAIPQMHDFNFGVKAAPPKPPGVKGLVPANVPLHDQPLLRRSADKAMATGQRVHANRRVAFPKARGAGVIESLSQKYTAAALDAAAKEALFFNAVAKEGAK